LAKQHLAYISRAAQNLSAADVEDILTSSRRNNGAKGITGHLQCHAGYFFQVLEGPAPALEALLEKLKQDPRHQDMRVLYRETLQQRNFADWSMGFGPCAHIRPMHAAPDKPLEELFTQSALSASQILGRFMRMMETAEA
jgi:hypothetical protein